MDVILQFRKPFPKGPVLAQRMEGRWMPFRTMDMFLSNAVSSREIRVPAAVASGLAIPPTNGVFRTAKDVIDAKTGWSIKESWVEFLHETEKAHGQLGIFEVKNIGIYTSLGNLSGEGLKTVIMPETIAAIYNLQPGKDTKTGVFGIPAEVHVAQSNDVIVRPITLGIFDILTNGSYQRKISVVSDPSGYYWLPIVVSMDKLMAKTDGAAEKLLDGATEIAGSLLIATREASKQILRSYLGKKAP